MDNPADIEALACCVCREPYDLNERLPLELQCTHVLCEACLHTLAPLICPICRRGYASEKEAVFGTAALPKDVLEAEAAEKEAAAPKMCKFCWRNKAEHAAAFACLDATCSRQVIIIRRTRGLMVEVEKTARLMCQTGLNIFEFLWSR